MIEIGLFFVSLCLVMDLDVSYEYLEYFFIKSVSTQQPFDSKVPNLCFSI